MSEPEDCGLEMYAVPKSLSRPAGGAVLRANVNLLGTSIAIDGSILRDVIEKLTGIADQLEGK